MKYIKKWIERNKPYVDNEIKMYKEKNKTMYEKLSSFLQIEGKKAKYDIILDANRKENS